MVAQQQFQSGDTVRMRGGNDAHLMTVKAASAYTVLCAWFGPSGKVQYAPYPPEELELVTRAAHPDAPDGQDKRTS